MDDRRQTLMAASVSISLLLAVIVVILMDWADAQGWPFRLVLAVGCLLCASLPYIVNAAFRRWKH